jgi:hypothetical protein
MTQWIADNKDGMGIRYVMHTGDIVNVANDAQYQNAKDSMNILTSAGIPYGVLGGNHDGSDGFVNYQKYFGAQNHYDLITSNGVNFVIVYLSYGIDSSEIAWASNIFQTYHDRIGILGVHEYIGSGGGYSGDGSALNTGVVLPNSNVWLVVCGHIAAARLNTKTVGSRTYYELLSDYQTLANGGNGYEKIFYFDLANSNVHVKTYSPTLNQWGGTGYSYDEFDMTLPQQSPTVPTPTVTGAYHGARLTWTDVGALSYNIYYSLSSDVSSATQYTTGVTGTTFDVKDLLSATWDKTCYYWVAPVGSGGEAAKSSWGMGSDKVWAYKIEITSVTAVKQVAGDLKVNVQYRSRYLGSEGITVGVQIGEFLGPGTVSDVPNRLISITSTNPIALSSFMSTGTFNSESTSSEFVRGSSYKAWVFLWNQLPSDPGYWEPYATKAELIPITIS